ncbi:neuropeptide Y receptor type 2-like [Mytilus californianus]|uniref:neuropeptide Y receptor type 2-like n=1 Tax=Mytilus californianus TaxID=6549 RepID=UPI002245412B|nr:neuropeptide Y receptor type 2-like [Mytilus californianus]
MENITNITTNNVIKRYVNDSSSEQVMENTVLMATYIVLYCVIFILGVSGNCLVVFVVVRKKEMRTVINIFITNLAVSDILLCLLAVPFTPISYYLQSWVFGEFFCHLVSMTLAICVYVSTLTSTTIAVIRYRAIVYPLTPPIQISNCYRIIVIIWLISISISVPLGVYTRITQSRDGSIDCVERWPTDQSSQIFSITSLLLQYIVPCFIIMYCYTSVFLVLKRRIQSGSLNQSKTKKQEEIDMKRKQHTNKMLVTMVTIFVCCWLPLNITISLAEYISTFSNWHYFTLCFFSAHIVAMSSVIYNPFLYGCMSDNFKNEFKSLF